MQQKNFVIEDVPSELTDRLINKAIANDRYLLQEVISSGQFGYVYKGIEISSLQPVAIKVIPKSKLNEYPILKKLIPAEITALKKCNSQNVLKYIYDCQTLTNFYIVTEFCNGGDLYTQIVQKKYFNETEALEMFCQILSGVKEFHVKGIAHRDLKPQNILINNGVLKIADFGFARIYDKTSVRDENVDIFQTCLGSPLFMAPEILLSKPYGIKSDIYSLGVLFYILLQGNFPFYYKDLNDQSDEQLAQLIKTTPLTFRQDIYISDDTKDLLKKMMIFNPQERISFSQLYQHQTVTQIISPTALVSEARHGVDNSEFKKAQLIYANQEKEIDKQMIEQEQEKDNQKEQKLNQFINSVEKTYSSSISVISESEKRQQITKGLVDFINQVCKQEVNGYIYLAQTIYSLSAGLNGLDQNTDISFQYCYYIMLYRLCLSWKKICMGKIKSLNIFNCPNFEILKNLQEYKDFLREILEVHYEIVIDYEKWELSQFLKHQKQINNQHVQKCLAQKEINETFCQSYKQLVMKMYLIIKQKKLIEKKQLQIQLKIAQCYDLNQFLKKQNLIEYQNIVNQNISGEKWKPFLEQEIKKAEELMK